MRLIGGPNNGGEHKGDTDGVIILVTGKHQMRAYIHDELTWYLDRWKDWVGFNKEGIQVCPPLFGQATYEKTTYQRIGEAVEYVFVYKGTKWPDDTLENFLKENPQ